MLGHNHNNELNKPLKNNKALLGNFIESRIRVRTGAFLHRACAPCVRILIVLSGSMVPC